MVGLWSLLALLFGQYRQKCGAIGYEVTFLPLKAFISYVNLRFFGLFVLVLPLKKWDGNTMLPLV